MTKLLSTFWFLSSNTQTDDEYEERNRRGTQRHTDTYTEKSDKTRTVAAKHYLRYYLYDDTSGEQGWRC